MTTQVDEIVCTYLEELKAKGAIQCYLVLDDGTCEFIPYPALKRIHMDLDKYRHVIDDIVSELRKSTHDT
jgi:hypothetical protein